MEGRIKDNFGAIWPQHVSNFTDLLIAARKACHGDLDLLLLIAVIGDRTYPASGADPGQDYESWARSGGRTRSVLEINIRSIADFTGIPRETVRRKVTTLIEKGWVSRGPGETIRATLKAQVELEPMTEQSIRYLARMFRVFDSLER